MKLLTITKHEHIRYWKDGKFLLVTLLAGLLFLVLLDSPLKYVLLAIIHAHAPDVTVYAPIIYQIFAYDFYIIFLPTLLLFVAYNTVCRDVSQGSIRYVVSRVSRREFIFGKFLALVVYLILLILSGFLVVSITKGVSIIALLPSIFHVLCYGLFWLSLYFLLSVLLNRSMLVILFGLFVLFVLFILAFMHPYLYVSPFHYVAITMQAEILYQYGAVLLIYGVAFLSAAYAFFEVKNL